MAGSTNGNTPQQAGAAPPRDGKPIEIGVQSIDSAQLAALGAASGCTTDCESIKELNSEAINKAMVDHVNANGGFGGRKVSAVIYEIDLKKSGTDNAQAACAKWTQDHKVSMLVLPYAVDDLLVSCAKKNQIPFVNGTDGRYNPDSQDLRSIGHLYYAAYNFNAERLARTYIKGLVRQGFLRPNNKIGLIHHNSPTVQRVVASTVKPLLAAEGLKLEATAEFTTDDTGGSGSSKWQGFVFQFKSRGVDRVLEIGEWATPSVLFGTAAEAQGYRPLYGFHSGHTPDIMKDFLPPEQLTGSRAVGWEPIYDDGSQELLNKTGVLCQQISDKAKQPRSNLFAFFKFCDGYLLFKTIADRSGGDVSGAALSRVADGLGRGFDSPFTVGANFRPGDHSGADQVRPLGYVVSCDCYRYDGPRYQAPA